MARTPIGPQRVTGAALREDCQGSLDAGWPLHSDAATRRIEAAAAIAMPAHALMARAGEAVARLARAVAPHARHVWIAAGPGNNGGDGLVAALALQRAGQRVTVSLAASTLPADAAQALRQAQDAGVRLAHQALPASAELQPHDLVVDAVFGLGLARPPQGWARDVILQCAALRAPVLAVDLPSGLLADTGRTFDDAAVRARWTLGLLTLKPGLFTGVGRDHAGDVWFDPLGVADAAAPSGRLLTSVADAWPQRRHAQHKGSFGDVWAVGGARGMRGAVLLAARAAAAAGAGRVLIVPADGDANPGGLNGAVDPLHPELMERQVAALADPQTPLEHATVVCGCGGGDAVRALLPGLIGRAGRLLLDADALNAVAADDGLGTLLRHRAARGRPTVLTPHPLEAARLLGCSTQQVQEDRLHAAQALAQRYDAVVVLKGSGSVIAGPQGAPSIAGCGNAALATAGTGDVLAGWTAGLWSQGLLADRAACLATVSHGLAADQWRADHPARGALVASDLVVQLRLLRDG